MVKKRTTNVVDVLATCAEIEAEFIKLRVDYTNRRSSCDYTYSDYTYSVTDLARKLSRNISKLEKLNIDREWNVDRMICYYAKIVMCKVDDASTLYKKSRLICDFYHAAPVRDPSSRFGTQLMPVNQGQRPR